MEFCNILHGREIIETLRAIEVKHKTRYPNPSQQKILELLQSKHNIQISRRHLNRILRKMEDEGWFVRHKRKILKPGVGVVFTSTVYILTKRAWKLLHQIYYRLRSLIPGARVTSKSHNTSSPSHLSNTSIDRPAEKGAKKWKNGLFMPGTGFIPYAGA